MTNFENLNVQKFFKNNGKLQKSNFGDNFDFTFLQSPLILFNPTTPVSCQLDFTESKWRNFQKKPQKLELIIYV